MLLPCGIPPKQTAAEDEEEEDEDEEMADADGK